MKKVISRGFTLIELLVVIAIIGILASIVLVSLNSARSKGKDTRVLSDVNQARTQLESDIVGSVYQDLYAGTVSTNSIVGLLTTINTTANTNLTTLSGDANTNGSSQLVYHITTNSTPGLAAGPANATAYAIYGKTSTGYYCVDSTGNNSTKTDGSNPPTPVSTSAATCGN